MPAEFEQGFFVHEPAWHGLGVVLGDYPGREEGMRLAGHDFEVVEQRVLIDLAGRNVWDRKTVPGWKVLLKDDSDHVLNIVRDSYEVVQNDTLWDLTDALVNEPNVKYETAGTLKGGAVCWVLARLDEPIKINGDPSETYPYISAMTTHDGSGALQAIGTAVRIVCMNTYGLADSESQRTGLRFTFRHTKNVQARIEDAKAAIRGVKASFAEFAEVAEALAKLPTNGAQERFFVDTLIPMPEDVLISDRVKANIHRDRDSVRAILTSSVTTEHIRGTAYGLFQAGIEYLDHIRKAQSKETKFGRSLLRQERVKGSLVRLAKAAAAA